ncbi:MAG: S8 family serine peptidase [Acidobacteriota bacterium]
MVVSNALAIVNGYATRMTAAQIKLMLESDVIEYVTLDAPIRTNSTSSFQYTTGVDRVKASGYTGNNIVVAVFDSGIGAHSDLAGGRIRAAVNVTSGTPVVVNSNTDGYGHGTAVAGIIGGSGSLSSGLHSGVAPGVQFVDVKVISNDGSGLTSNLIRAIDWVIANRSTYNIRVANFSLGHAPVESHTMDPLCQAVERLVASGIVAVASSGNTGKTTQYSKVWGAINSPGNSPAAITVYPINTRGTATHTDDVATTYGSRGSTHKAGLFKPDLSAPGNAIPVPSLPGSYLSTKLSAAGHR